MLRLEQSKINRVVVRGTNWVGDAVMTIPALRKIRKILPQAQITLASRSWAKDLFAEADYVDEFLTAKRGGIMQTLREARAWSKRDFDLAFILPNSFGAALVPALARIKYRLGYDTDRRRILLTHPVALPDWRDSRHEAYYYLNLVDEVEKLLTGRVEIAVPDFGLHISERRTIAAPTLLSRYGVSESDMVIALCPGSINSRAKRWPAENYAALADLLIENLEAKVLLIGSAAEIDVSSEVRTRMRHEPISLTGETTLHQLVGVLNRVDLLITNDTGPAHIASALGRPTLVIFGPTNPLTTRPFSDAAQIIRQPPDCAPCMLRDCPIDHRCMTAITPTAVFERATSMVNTLPTFDNELLRGNQSTPISR
jgi:heptosyltransferase-2